MYEKIRENLNQINSELCLYEVERKQFQAEIAGIKAALTTITQERDRLTEAVEYAKQEFINKNPLHEHHKHFHGGCKICQIEEIIAEQALKESEIK